MAESTASVAPRLDRAARETRVLDAADRLFYARGVHEVGMDELIEASGLGKATVYRLYPTKDVLIGAYLRRRSDRIAEAIATRVAESLGNPRAALRAIIDDVARDVGRSEFRGCAFNNASIEFDDPEQPARQEARAYRDDLWKTLTELAEALAPGHGARLGAALAVLIDGCYTSALHLGPDGPATHGLALARSLVTEA
jgi:AcrR family transcriptional regulator